MDFYVSVQTVDDVQGVVELQCKTRSDCKIQFKRSYTPVLHYINPPVVYYDMETEFFFDPKSTTSVIEDLLSDELPFINDFVRCARTYWIPPLVDLDLFFPLEPALLRTFGALSENVTRRLHLHVSM